MAQQGLPIRVFLAEDSNIIRERLTESLSEPGRIEIVGQAVSEGEAIEALKREPCDALVLDLQLKQGNGLGVLKALKALPMDDRRPLVIVLTNYAFPHYRNKSLQLGADFFLDKSRDYERVRDVLGELAEARESHQELSSHGRNESSDRRT